MVGLLMWTLVGDHHPGQREQWL